MRYPIPPTWRTLGFWLMLALTLGISRLMARSLETPAAPYGIVSLELAGNTANARAMIDSWDAATQDDARCNVGVDFLFLLVYSTTLSLGCMWAASVLRSPKWLAASGVTLAWLQWVAALLDAIENIGLWQMLHGHLEAPWPQIARWCAIPKFALVLLGAAYIVLVGGGAWLWRRMSGHREA